MTTEKFLAAANKLLLKQKNPEWAITIWVALFRYTEKNIVSITFFRKEDGTAQIHLTYNEEWMDAADVMGRFKNILATTSFEEAKPYEK